ncbi:MAG: winged helix-turn-helix transcriptional regulator [Mycobacteriales bacterium]
MISDTARDCSVASALEVIGDRWSLLAVRELFLGVSRFNELVSNTGAPRDVLTARLRKLEQQGVVERRPYSERPPRYDYVLTAAGRDLAPVLSALRHWGDEHVRHGKPPVQFTHTCGHRYVPEPHCQACGEVTEPGSLRFAKDRRGRRIDGLHA